MISCYRHSWPGLGGYNFLLCFDGCRSDKRFSLLAWFSQAVRGICYYWKHVYNSDRFILFLIIENQFKQYTDLITSQSVDQIAGMLRQLMIKKNAWICLTFDFLALKSLILYICYQNMNCLLNIDFLQVSELCALRSKVT